jgi:hypothetical protein
VNIEEIISQIDEEISKLQQAKAVLDNVAMVDSGRKNKVGRPKKSSIAARILSVQPAKRTLSDEAKERIAAAQRKRWAKSRRVAKATKPVKRVKKTAAKKAVRSTPLKAPTPTA